MEKRIVIILLFWGVCFGYPAPLSAAIAHSNPSLSHRVFKKTPTFSQRKIRKIERLQKKVLEKLGRHGTSPSPDFWLWMGLFCLGLGFCLALFSVTLGGIVSAAGLGCLFIWGFFKLGAL